MKPFIGQVMLFAGDYEPEGWMRCDGRQLSIMQHPTLYSILGTIYGGDGSSTFALPDLRGRSPMGMGQGITLTHRTIGERTGTEKNKLTAYQLPSHSHSVVLKTTDLNTGADDNQPGATRIISGKDITFSTKIDIPSIELSRATRETGAGHEINNVSPALVMNYLIAVQGIYPSKGG